MNAETLNGMLGEDLPASSQDRARAKEPPVSWKQAPGHNHGVPYYQKRVTCLWQEHDKHFPALLGDCQHEELTYSIFYIFEVCLWANSCF